MKRLIVTGFLLMVIVAGGLFADSATEVNYNKEGQINLTGIIGLNTWGFSVGAGAERIMGDLDFIPKFPMEWGVTARGLFSFYLFDNYSGMDYGVAPLATLHKGFNFGDGLEFDFTLGLGLGFYGYSYDLSGSNHSELIRLGGASFDSLSWKMSDDLWVTLEYSYVGWNSIYGIGVRMVR